MIVGALTFFPALSLGPIVEHYLMHHGEAVFDSFIGALELLMSHYYTSTPPVSRPEPQSLLPKKLAHVAPAV